VLDDSELNLIAFVSEEGVNNSEKILFGETLT